MSNSFKRFFLLTISCGLISVGLWAQASVEDVPKGWHLKDKQQDGYYGISINQAYDFVKSKNIKSKPVIVAVIDSGLTLHMKI